jgi:hypothetical protein
MPGRVVAEATVLEPPRHVLRHQHGNDIASFGLSRTLRPLVAHSDLPVQAPTGDEAPLKPRLAGADTGTMNHSHARLIADALVAGSRLVVGTGVEPVDRLPVRPAPREDPGDAVRVDGDPPLRQPLPEVARVAAAPAPHPPLIAVVPDLFALRAAHSGEYRHGLQGYVPAHDQHPLAAAWAGPVAVGEIDPDRPDGRVAPLEAGAR